MNPDYEVTITIIESALADCLICILFKMCFHVAGWLVEFMPYDFIMFLCICLDIPK